jgi:hypothetical protein
MHHIIVTFPDSLEDFLLAMPEFSTSELSLLLLEDSALETFFLDSVSPLEAFFSFFCLVTGLISP